MKMLEISGDPPRAEKLPAAELSVSARDFRPIIFTWSLLLGRLSTCTCNKDGKQMDPYACCV